MRRDADADADADALGYKCASTIVGRRNEYLWWQHDFWLKVFELSKLRWAYGGLGSITQV